ncbi:MULTISPECIES: YitT family protein [unclassified Virgibacillus]|uniref:YitT family protein n=1 Tax=unclassified Virgibacillus TaxID=2620237 RepID=UPI0024DE817D|nr:YitT family protein [Virgibacillus sp. LDC-1]
MNKTFSVILGGVIQGFGMGLFLFPQSIPSGGAGGLALVIHHFFSVGMGLSLWIVNFSLLLCGMYYLGKRFVLWTIVGISITSFSIYFFEQLFFIEERLLWFDLFVGSIFLGTGIGLLMRSGVSNGGIGVIAFMISHWRNTLPGKPLFWINCCIFLLTAAIISWKVLILAFISQWISTFVVNMIYRY